MTTFNQKSQKMLDAYKENLKNFIRENSLDAGLYEDIEERIYEKISHFDNPTHADVSAVLKEIWTPEEIFWEELQTEEKSQASQTFLQKFKKITSEVVF